MPKKTVEAIVASGNHYLIQVKANQPSLLGDITKTMNNRIAHSVYQTQEKSRGRLETRTVTTYQVQHSDLQSIWSGLSTYIRVERTRQTAQKTTVEQAFYITDWSTIQKGAEYFYKGIRQHWHIENSLHYVKDVIHKEDKNKLKNKGAIIASIISSVAINIGRKNAQWSIEDNQILFRANIKKTIKLIRT